MIFVKNTNDFDHVDRYNGVDYLFPVGEEVMVDEAAAAHMLGYGKADKSETMNRLGWSFKYDEEAKKVVPDLSGVDKLKNFIFSQGTFVRKADETNDAQPDLLAQE